METRRLATLFLCCLAFGCQPQPRADGTAEATLDDAAVAVNHSTSSAPATECVADSDCSLSKNTLSGDHACCDRCQPVAANASWLKTFEESCTPKQRRDDCPVLRCPRPSPMKAACVSGQCQAVPDDEAPDDGS